MSALDEGAQRCLRFLVDGEGNLDDLLECYGPATEFVPPEPPTEGVLVDDWLVERIDRVYDVVSRHGFVSEPEFERSAIAWLEESGCR